MKKTGHTIAAAAFAFTLAAGAPVALAGSSAAVVQNGDDNYSVVYQLRNKTIVNKWNGANAGQKIIAEKKVAGAINFATRPRIANGNKAGANKCGNGLGLTGANSAYAFQNGVGNSAFVKQAGVGNSASIDQNGNNNASYIYQKGTGHTASSVQDGNSNTSVIVQRC